MLERHYETLCNLFPEFEVGSREIFMFYLSEVVERWKLLDIMSCPSKQKASAISPASTGMNDSSNPGIDTCRLQHMERLRKHHLASVNMSDYTSQHAGPSLTLSESQGRPRIRVDFILRELDAACPPPSQSTPPPPHAAAASPATPKACFDLSPPCDALLAVDGLAWTISACAPQPPSRGAPRVSEPDACPDPSDLEDHQPHRAPLLSLQAAPPCRPPAPLRPTPALGWVRVSQADSEAQSRYLLATRTRRAPVARMGGPSAFSAVGPGGAGWARRGPMDLRRLLNPPPEGAGVAGRRAAAAAPQKGGSADGSQRALRVAALVGVGQVQ